MNDLLCRFLLNILPFKIAQCKIIRDIAKHILEDAELEQRAIGQMEAYETMKNLIEKWTSETPK